MITWVKWFLNDQAGFERIARAGIVAFAIYAQSQGWISAAVAAALSGGGMMIAAGQKNPKPGQGLVSTETLAKAITDNPRLSAALREFADNSR